MLVKILSQQGGKTSTAGISGGPQTLKRVSSLIQEAPSVLADWWGVQVCGGAAPQQSVRTDEASQLQQLQKD